MVRNRLQRLRTRWRTTITPALNLVVFSIVLLAVDRVMREYHWHEVAHALRALPVLNQGLAALIVLPGYLALVGCDYVAFRYVGRPLPFRVMVIPSFVSFAVANNAPAAVVTGGGVRYRLYQRHGLTPAEATAVAAFNAVTYALGLCAVAGPGLLILESGLPFFSLSTRLLGGLLLLVPAFYLLIARRQQPVQVGHWTVRVPGLPLAGAQIGLSVADWLLSAGALYVLLLGIAPVPFLSFLAPFLAAQFAALVLPVPGGLGVIETVVLLLRPAGTSAPAVLAALLMYRVIYYLGPLLLAGLIMIGAMLQRVRRTAAPARTLLAGLLSLAPRVLAFTTFMAGVLLLLTGAIPASDRRVAWLGELLPLGVIEASHFLSSIVGAVLIAVAWALERRNRTAYQLARMLFGFGILLTLLRSFDTHLALFLLVCLFILLAAGKAFPRTESLAREPLGPGWISAIGGILIVQLWIVSLLYTHTELKQQIWWRFALFGTGSRSLRASVGAAVVILLFAVVRLLSRHSAMPGQHARSDPGCIDSGVRTTPCGGPM